MVWYGCLVGKILLARIKICKHSQQNQLGLVAGIKVHVKTIILPSFRARV